MGGAADELAQVSLNSCSLETKGNCMSNFTSDSVLNLEIGDPNIFQEYWQKMGERCTLTISGCQSLSYFSATKNLCWYVEPRLHDQIKKLHNLVGNAVTESHYIVVGTGSLQLVQAALYALSSTTDAPLQPMNVVSAVPYYSSYEELTDYLKSGLYKWAGDAATFHKEEPYIEIVTSPNNPDGSTREAIVNRSGGLLIHDFAYYWPQYTPITSMADHELMLFTLSKITGHAGSRIGWALVKDKDVATKMTKFISINTNGVSKDSQLRAAKILQAVYESCQCHSSAGSGEEVENFFKYGRRQMKERWERLRMVMKNNKMLSLPNYSTEICNFFGEESETHPAFAWFESKNGVDDCEEVLKYLNIHARNGKRFGGSTKFVRVNMLDRDDKFNEFLRRLSPSELNCG